MSINLENHPLLPFLPPHSKLLLLGSFPASRKRWSMDFFYTNLQNDMLRLFGLVFFNDSMHFLSQETGGFDQKKIEVFLNQKGIALYDTAVQVVRGKGTASDQFLEVIQATDVFGLLEQIPSCTAIATTGEKATMVLCGQTGAAKPEIGKSTTFWHAQKEYSIFRLPSSSRAYPKPLKEKAIYYAKMFRHLGLL